MAKNRMLSTSFWNDGYTSNLDPIEKLLFIYLITNERSTLAGVYELPLKIMAVETGIETEMVRKILFRFEEDNKIKFFNGWVAVRNFAKHHPAGSPTVQKGIEDALKVAPEWAKGYIKGIYTLSPSASASASVIAQAREPIEVVETHEKEETERVAGKERNAYESMLKWAEQQRGSKFVDRVKQYTALKRAKKVSIPSSSLKERWVEMSEDKFWEEKGFDWTHVVSSFNRKGV